MSCGAETRVEAPHNYGFYECGLSDEDGKTVLCDRCKNNDKILLWIKNNKFQHHQGGYLIHSDDLEAFVKNLKWDKGSSSGKTTSEVENE